MNLYAIRPTWSPQVEFMLAESEGRALEAAVFAAAHDLVSQNYGSPTAEVYLIAENVRHVGTAYATDAPRNWDWAHPAVEEAIAEMELDEASDRVDQQP